MLCYIFLLFIYSMPRYICYVIYIMLSYIILYYVILSYIILCYLILYYIMLYYIIYYINVQLGVSTITQPSSDRPNMLK